MALTPNESERKKFDIYIELKARACPECGKAGVRRLTKDAGPAWEADLTPLVKVSCYCHCGYEWIEVYKLDRVEPHPDSRRMGWA